jgi:hypothetical protein
MLEWKIELVESEIDLKVEAETHMNYMARVEIGADPETELSDLSEVSELGEAGLYTMQVEMESL